MASAAELPHHIPGDIRPLGAIIEQYGNCVSLENMVKMVPKSIGGRNAYSTLEEYREAKADFDQKVEEAKEVCRPCQVQQICYEYCRRLSVEGVFAGEYHTYDESLQRPPSGVRNIDEFVQRSVKKYLRSRSQPIMPPPRTLSPS